jgi:hypothetical protein
MGKHLSDIFSVQNGLKQDDAVLTLLVIFALEFSIGGIEIKWDISAYGQC